MLASIQKIKELNPIDNADAIEVATVLGWNVVVKKGEFKVGDLCVFFEIDSFLPLLPQFAFLPKATFMGENQGYRLRTIKLRGQISQGLALPLESFWADNPSGENPHFWFTEGEDVSEKLGVLKYEKPIPTQLRGQVRGQLPWFIKKTDEERVQNIPDRILEQWMEQQFIQTEKRDGSSMTVFVHTTEKKDGEDEEPYMSTYVGVCSRNLELVKTETNAFWNKAIELDLENKLLNFYLDTGRHIAVQGELFGEGIQGNPSNLNGKSFEIFNVWDIDNQRYLPPFEAMEIADGLEVPYVPFVNASHLKWFHDEYNSLLEAADKSYLQEDGAKCEGHVYKSVDPIGGEIRSFKVVSNQYLLKTEE